MVELPITLGISPFSKTVMLDFMIVDEDNLYQIILGRSFLRIDKAVMSKVNGVVGVVKRDQRFMRSCYATATKKAMQITSLDT